MIWVFYTVGVVYALLGLFCILSVLLGLPGTWILIALAVVIELTDGYFMSDPNPTTFGWGLILGCVALAAVGEVLEFIAGLLGAKKAGSSKRGMMGALLGGILGAIGGILIPIPIVGSVIGAILGTFLGAIAGELSGQTRTLKESIKPATGAALGKILGTLAKIPLTAVVWLLLTIAYFR